MASDDELREAYRLVRSVHVILMGVKADAHDAFAPVRSEQAKTHVYDGLEQAQASLGKLEGLLKRG